MGICVNFPILFLWFVWIKQMQYLLQFQWVHIFISTIISRSTVSWSHSSPLTFTISIPPFLYRLLSLNGVVILKIFYGGLNAPMSLTLYIVQFWVFVLIPSYCKKKLLWEELNNAICHWDSMLCSFSKTIALGFPIGPFPIWSQAGSPSLLQCQIWISTHGMALKFNKIVGLYHICAPIVWDYLTAR